jgi:deoxyribose-phosphate aldolase
MNPHDLARMIDLSCVQASSTLPEIDEAAALAREHGIYAVFVLPAHMPYLVERLAGQSTVLPAATVGFPGGGATTSVKVREAEEQLAVGAQEFDMVHNTAWLEAGELDRYREDISAVKAAIDGKPLKVILECHHLNDEQIVRASDICADIGVAFVKTGTGWAPTGATPQNVALIKKTVGDRCEVKAAGGVRDMATLLALREAGATRFGIGVRAAQGLLTGVADAAAAY